MNHGGTDMHKGASETSLSEPSAPRLALEAAPGSSRSCARGAPSTADQAESPGPGLGSAVPQRFSTAGPYVFDGVVRKYRPDFLIRLASGAMLVLEVKGQDSPQNQAKRAALDEWARAVTEHGGFGAWTWAVSRTPSDVTDLVTAASSS